MEQPSTMGAANGADAAMDAERWDEDFAAEELEAEGAVDEVLDELSGEGMDEADELDGADELAADEEGAFDALELDEADEHVDELTEAFADAGADGLLDEAADAEDDDALASLFIDTLDDEDAFVRGLLARGVRGLAGAAARAPRGRWPWQAAGELAGMLPIPQASRVGRLVNVVGPHLHQAAPYLQRLAQMLQERGADQVDVLADAMAEAAEEGADVDAFVAPLAGLAARAAVRAVTTPRARRAQPQRVHALGRAAVGAARTAVRALVARGGAAAARAIGPVMRTAVRAVAQRAAPARALPAAIARTAARVARSANAIRRLSRPVPAVRTARARLPQRTALRRPASPLRGYGGRARRRGRTIRLEVRVIR